MEDLERSLDGFEARVLSAVFVMLFEKTDLMNFLSAFGMSLSITAVLEEGGQADTRQSCLVHQLNINNSGVTSIQLDPGMEVPLPLQLVFSSCLLSPAVRRLPPLQLSISNISLRCKPFFSSAISGGELVSPSS